MLARFQFWVPVVWETTQQRVEGGEVGVEDSPGLGTDDAGTKAEGPQAPEEATSEVSQTKSECGGVQGESAAARSDDPQA